MTRSLGKSVVLACCLSLHGQSLHPQVVGFVQRRELHGVSTRSMEVDSKESPLTLQGIRNTLDRADVHRDPGGLGVGDQDSMTSDINKDLAWLKVLRVIFRCLVSLDGVHFLDLLLSLGALNLAFVKSDFQVSLLQFV